MACSTLTEQEELDDPFRNLTGMIPFFNGDAMDQLTCLDYFCHINPSQFVLLCIQKSIFTINVLHSFILDNLCWLIIMFTIVFTQSCILR